MAATAASAQSYGGYSSYAAAPANEEVIVTAPRLHFREQGSGLRALDFPPEKVSLSTTVRFDDLDLTSWQGVSELRRRVRHAARAVCGELYEAYPFERLTTSTPCYRDAVENGLLRADSAAREAGLSIIYDLGE